MEDIQNANAALRTLTRKFGALGEAAIQAGTSFQDASRALEIVREDRYGRLAMKEPDACVFCGQEAERVHHSYRTQYLNPIAVWTRVCRDCLGEPLCPRHPWGVHGEIITGTDRLFLVRHTVVVDLDDLAGCGYCADCKTPLKLRRETVGHGDVWRYWTPNERAKLL